MTLARRTAPEQQSVSEPLESPTPQVNDWPPAREAWYAVFVFGLALMVNFLDRGIFALLVAPIKADLGLSDTQVSLVVGFAFVLFYAVLGLPIARLVDRYSRRTIIGACIVTWSGMTALCGLAQNFQQLFLLRVGVGVGEAGNGPATYSMLSDLFPPDRLPRAISVMNFGFVAGNGVALILGGLVIKAIADLRVSLPGVGELAAWQLTLIAVGLPGLIVAGLLATMKEPRRRGAASRESGEGGRAMPVRAVFRFLVQHGAAYGSMTLGMAAKAVMSVGMAVWLPTHFHRKFDWALADIGLAQGLVLLCGAPLGLMAGSFAAEFLAKRGHDGANVMIVLLSAVLAIPFTVAYPLAASPVACLALYGASTVLLFMAPGPQNAAIQIITPNRMRGQVTALWLFVFNVVGFGLGPTLVALFTDFHFRDEARLGEAMALTAGLLGTLSVVALWSGLGAYARSVRQARQWAEAGA